MSTAIGELVRKQKIIVCCGAGGVGKTTTAASLAVGAARIGRRVLVLTIDPSRRLAETLGVEQNPPAPVAVSAERLAAAGISGPGRLDAWMLDPKRVADQTVRRLFKEDADYERVIQNKIYQQCTRMVAGMHEYTAMEALHGFVNDGRYDLVILDTPPSRHALDFLEAPGRLAQFLDGRIFKLFLPSAGGIVRRAASSMVNRVFRGVFGESFAGDLTAFFSLFAGVFPLLSRNVSEMRELLSREDASFLLVTSPAPAALAEAVFFQEKTRELKLPFGGFVLNRSYASPHGKDFPGESLLPADAGPEARSGLEKLQLLARGEEAQAVCDRALLEDLRRRSEGREVVALPVIDREASEMTTLITLADVLLCA